MQLGVHQTYTELHHDFLIFESQEKLENVWQFTMQLFIEDHYTQILNLIDSCKFKKHIYYISNHVRIDAYFWQI